MAAASAVIFSNLTPFASPKAWSRSNRRQSRWRYAVMNSSADQPKVLPAMRVSEGNGGLSKLSLSSSHGSGGIPHCFPQFGPGLMQQHGFARNMGWSFSGSENIEGDPSATLELKDDSYSRSMWDYSFHASYRITLKSKTLSTVLTITNTDKKQFSFSSALHTYFHASIAGVKVKGLKGCKALNKDPDPANPIEGVEEREVITFPGFVDCVYLNAPNELQFDNGLGDIINVKNKNWSDIVLWNPHLQMENSYKDFVCVENAKIGKVELEPEQSWTAEQHISVS